MEVGGCRDHTMLLMTFFQIFGWKLKRDWRQRKTCPRCEELQNTSHLKTARKAATNSKSCTGIGGLAVYLTMGFADHLLSLCRPASMSAGVTYPIPLWRR